MMTDDDDDVDHWGAYRENDVYPRKKFLA